MKMIQKKPADRLASLHEFRQPVPRGPDLQG